MLTCLYHPIDGVNVVEEGEEAERLRKSGVWFDNPNDAKNYKKSVEEDIKKENEAEKHKKTKKVEIDEPTKCNEEKKV
jgi:hypothetical protein